MNQLTTESEQQRFMEIASEYEAEGYEVKLRPTSAELPDFLRGFEPDLIAVGKGESVAVQVKARSELNNELYATSLESVLRNRPGWRFELIIEGAAAEPETVGASQIRASLDEADELQRTNHMAAALLLLPELCAVLGRVCWQNRNEPFGDPKNIEVKQKFCEDCRFADQPQGGHPNGYRQK